MRDRRVVCKWSCEKCQKAGTMRVWPYAKEPKAATADREAQHTRTRCVVGCLFTAKPKADGR